MSVYIQNEFTFTNSIRAIRTATKFTSNPDMWKVTDQNGNLIYNASENMIITAFRSGEWTAVAAPEPELDPALQVRLDYFQVHIAAVEENLASLKAAFNKLQQDVKG